MPFSQMSEASCDRAAFLAVFQGYAIQPDERS